MIITFFSTKRQVKNFNTSDIIDVILNKSSFSFLEKCNLKVRNQRRVYYWNIRK